jgi:Cas10/Cmr2, second palm domain/CRISPR-associated protein Cmr2, N-terminal
MADYVFSLGLIPVQEWIAQARRSRDLRAGSVFLWHVMARVLARLERELTGVEIWTPHPPKGGFSFLADLPWAKALAEGRYGIPNRASGMCRAPESAVVVRTFQAFQRDVVEAAWEDLHELALTRLKKEKAAAEFWSALEPHWSVYRKTASAGEDCPLTLIWAAQEAPYPPEHRDDNLKSVYALFADVKRSRPLRAWKLGAPIGKCNQCGQHEAIGPTQGFEKWQDWHAKRAEDPWLQHGYRLDPAERLCYVCLVKRVAGYASAQDFPSTGEVAARLWLARLEGISRLRDLVHGLRRTALGRLDFGRALYGSIEGLPDPERSEVLKLRDQIRRGIEEQNRRPASPEWHSPLTPTPPSYLALLTFDGDDMGRLVQAYPHRTPSALASFAKAAADQLADREATAFYLAGDEGLAMVPAEAALDLAFALREAFTMAFADFDVQPTMSLGIAYFEHRRPMRGAILAARAALEKAKSSEGKNALGVAIETASGSRWGFVARWGDDWQRVRKAVALIREGALSSGWAYDAERFCESMPPPPEWQPEVAAAARAELRRLFLRRLQVLGKKTPEERHAARLQAWNELPGETWWPLDNRGILAPADPQQFHLIGFLARQGSTQESPAGEE